MLVIFSIFCCIFPLLLCHLDFFLSFDAQVLGATLLQEFDIRYIHSVLNFSRREIVAALP